MDSTAPLKERIRMLAGALGFDAVGFAGAEPTDNTRRLREWVARGFAGEMAYIEDRLEERVDPRKVLATARSLIVVGVACPPNPDRASTAEDGSEARGRIARYAGGDDYHDVMLDRVHALAAAIEVIVDRPLDSRRYVDTGPVAERAAAVAAGLGWIGKNSCLIHPDLGSHLMLGVILSELDLDPDDPVSDHCGTCRACLDVCPTDAFAQPYVLDATRCISYTTIEARGAIPESLRAGQGDHVFGCDLCQTVCPWNQSRPRTPLADPLGLRDRLAARTDWVEPSLAWLLDLDPEAFSKAASKTALRRSGWRGLIRNALVAAGNARDPELRSAIERHASGPDEMLADHARWALEQIDAA